MVQLYIGFGIGAYSVIALLIMIHIDNKTRCGSWSILLAIIWPITIFMLGLMELIDL